MNCFRFISTLLILTSLFWGCKKNERTPERPSSNRLIKVLYQTDSLLTISPYTGEEIKPVVTVLGDTIHPHQSISASPIKVAPEKIVSPEKIPVGLVERVEMNLDKNELVESHESVPLNNEAIIVTDLNQHNRSEYSLVNSIGKPLLTGQKLPVSPKSVKCFYPEGKPVPPFSMLNTSQMDIRYFDVGHGLSSSYISAITRDQKGDLWIGTTDAGVIRYNGTSFFTYTMENGLIHNSISDIFSDRAGNLWFCSSENGVCKYDGEKFLHYTENTGLSSNAIRTIAEDANGHIWLGTSNSGLMELTGDSACFYTENEGLGNNRISSLCTDSKGQLWIGTIGAGLHCLTDNKILRFDKETGLCHSNVKCLFTDDTENIWIGTMGGGVDIFDGKSFTNVSKENNYGRNHILSISQSNDGNIWIGTNGAGLIKYNKKHINRIFQKCRSNE